MTISASEVLRMRGEIKEARDTADEADNKINTHEQLCTLRYEGIAKELNAIKKYGFWGLIMLASLMKEDKIQAIALKVMGL